MTEIGLKIGSQNSAAAMRIDNEITTVSDKTRIRFPQKAMQIGNDKPLVGDTADDYADVIKPLQYGVIEKDEGKKQVAQILTDIFTPKGFVIPDADIVLASPAVEMKAGRELLKQAVYDVYRYRTIKVFSEGLCSAVYILNDPERVLDSTFFTLNLGSTTTEFGCFSEGRNIHLSAHSEYSGDSVDRAIEVRIRNVTGDSLVTIKNIRTMKESASLLETKHFSVNGLTRDGVKPIQISSEITDPLRNYAIGVADIIKREILGNINPETRKLAMSAPLIISGGMSNIHGMPELITSILNEKMNWEFQENHSLHNNSHIAPAIGALLLAEAIAKEDQSP